MDSALLVNALVSYICLIIIITFHEAAHAWTAWKRGDDTARLLGRISLNPIVHMEVIGTVVLPLAGLFLGATGSRAAGFIIGWGKPVPFNPARLKHGNYDGMLIALAGPAMNVVLAMVAVILARIAVVGNAGMIAEFLVHLALLSLFLCFFNLLPIPPLDGSHVARFLLNWSDEMYFRVAQFGFIIIIVVIQIPAVRGAIGFLTNGTLKLMLRTVGFEL
ncbi:MAG TPA: site-2 protease family protein [Methylomirabilota bacterium]|nr:site-2 protease family protein [Methylomirabilota bacterium]